MDTSQQKALRALHRRRRQLIRKLLLIAVVVSVLAYWLWPKYITPSTSVRSSDSDSVGNSTSGAPRLVKETPKFETVTPKAESISKFGGWTRVSPEQSEPVYAFADTIGGVYVIISQQELPDDFSANPGESVAEFAKNISANRSIDSPEGTEIFIGTSAKGPQSIVFTKNGLLILIKADSALNDGQWTGYIDSLK